MDNNNHKTKIFFQILGILVSIFLLCSGWVYGILKETDSSSIRECKAQIEKLQDKTIPAIEQILMNHEKILPVLQKELETLNKSIEKLERILNR